MRFRSFSVVALWTRFRLKICLFLMVLCLPPAAAQNIDPISPEQIQKHFGVNVAMTANCCAVSVAINDREESIDSSTLEQDALRNTWNRLETLVAQKEREIQNKYGIRLGHDGDLTSGDGYGKFSKRTYSVRVRSAKLAELFALDYALAHSAPSHLVENSGRGVHVYFLRERRTCGVIAEWGFDRDNQPAIFIEPNYQSTPKGKHLEFVLIHELAHNAEVRMGLDPYCPESWPLARQLGWFSFSNPETGEKGWMMSSTESANHFYKFAQLSGMWVRCNRNGQPLTDNGTRVERQIDARRLSPEQMKNFAAVRPPTLYFCNPMEMVAEALMMLRSSRANRQHFMRANPWLYDLLKRHDQEEIDGCCVQKKCLRSPDGLLVADNPSSNSELSEFETSTIASRPSEPQNEAASRLTPFSDQVDGPIAIGTSD